MSTLRTLIPLLIVTTALAQDPPPPPGGFTPTDISDRLITWSDGFLTRMDVHLPMANPGPRGWPGVLVFHGGGGDRKRVADICIDLARHGYVAYAYDIRSHGQTIMLNPPPATLDNSQDRRLLDSAEAHRMAWSIAHGIIDLDRLAVAGGSLGGNHTLRAAAYSGRRLPVTGFVTHYPLLLAAAPLIAALDRPDDYIPDGLLLGEQFAGIAFNDPTGLDFTELRAGKYESVRARLEVEPGAEYLSLLADCRVPIFCEMVWHDWHRGINVSVDAFADFEPHVPRRFLWTTGGHGMPLNNGATTVLNDLRRRWFDRFVKAIPNGVDTEPMATAAVIPPDPTSYLAPTTDWAHRSVDAWPPQEPRSTHYLHGNGVLDTVAPSAGLGPVLRHDVKDGYDLFAYMQQGAGNALGAIAQNIQFESLAFRGAVLTEPIEILGRAQARLRVITTEPTMQIQVAILHQDPTGVQHFITSGASALRHRKPGPHDLTFDLDDTAIVVPTGHRIVIRVENLAWFRPYGQSLLKYVPEFTDCEATLVLGSFGCSVELPIRAAVEPSLTPALAFASVAGGLTHTMSIDAGSGAAGGMFNGFIGTHGAWPGTAVGALPLVPVNFDGITSMFQSFSGSGLANDLTGTLDPAGRGVMSIMVPPAIAGPLAGMRLTFGILVQTPAGFAAGGPAELILDP